MHDRQVRKHRTWWSSDPCGETWAGSIHCNNAFWSGQILKYLIVAADGKCEPGAQTIICHAALPRLWFPGFCAIRGRHRVAKLAVYCPLKIVQTARNDAQGNVWGPLNSTSQSPTWFLFKKYGFHLWPLNTTYGGTAFPRAFTQHTTVVVDDFGEVIDWGFKCIPAITLPGLCSACILLVFQFRLNCRCAGACQVCYFHT